MPKARTSASGRTTVTCPLNVLGPVVLPMGSTSRAQCRAGGLQSGRIPRKRRLMMNDWADWIDSDEQEHCATRADRNWLENGGEANRGLKNLGRFR